MPTENTKRIEEAATTALKNAFLRCRYIDSYIDSNDKTPSWDGTVLVYSDEKWKKEDLIGRVPIQVKGTKTRLISDVASFACSVADLKNYYNEGGIVFFLISVDLSTGVNHIFYASLLTYDLSILLDSAKEQRAKTIQLKRFPENDETEMANIFLEFLDNRPRQMSFIGKKILSVEDLLQKGVAIESLSFGTNTLFPNQESLEQYITTHDFYLYAKVKGLDTDIVVDKISNPSLTRNISESVSVSGKRYFPSYSVLYQEGKCSISINKGLRVDISDDRSRIHLNYKPSGTLSDVIAETSLLVAIGKHKELSLGFRSFRITDIPEEFLKQYTENLAFYREIKKMLDALGVKEELHFEELTERDFTNLKNLIGAVLYGRTIGFSSVNDDVLYGNFKIANLAPLIIATRQSDGFYKVNSLFEKHQAALFAEDDLDKKHPIQASQFLWLKKESFVHSSNMDYDRIIEDVASVNHSPEAAAYTTQLLMEILKGYDLQVKKDPDLLKLAEKICNWIADENCVLSQEANLLNKLQIVKRKRGFTVDELVSLAGLKSEKQSPDIRCGAFLLLDDNENAQKCFEMIPAEKRAEFISFPIAVFGDLTFSS